MNKKQWYAIAIFCFSIGCIMTMITIPVYDVQLRPIAECDVFFVIERVVYKLVGLICIIASFICWICGWLEKEDAR